MRRGNMLLCSSVSFCSKGSEALNQQNENGDETDFHNSDSQTSSIRRRVNQDVSHQGRRFQTSQPSPHFHDDVIDEIEQLEIGNAMQ